MQAPRACWTVTGSRERTRTAVLGALEGVPADVLWVGDEEVPWPTVAPGGLRRVLGSDRDVVVLDLTGGVDADRVGMAHGLVRAGGVLVLRVDPEAPGSPGLALHPYDPTDVTARLRDRLLERLPPGPPRLPVPCAPPTGTPEQAAVVDVLRARLSATEPTATVVLAPRGRGKSAALGLALAGLDARVALTSTDPDGLASVRRFCDAAPVDLEDVPPDAEVIVVDEAARVPLPALQRLVADHPCARLAFATTTDGYEGTGRGFVLRFLRWLEGERPTEVLRMSTPVRWAPDDPLERAVHDLFLLDLPLGPLPPGPLAHARLDRAALAADEPLLREVFALLVHAHYRTTPSDLHRILDAPNLDVHALFVGDRVGAVNLVAREGTLPAALSADLAAGRQRIRGHALADTLVCHAGRPDAGGLRMVRSVRLATHPDVRRRGLASRLVSAVHEAYDVDLFGTLFSADPDVVRFRRQHGYEVVRVGSSASARSGQPAVVMVRPVTPVARALLADLRAELALDWPTQRALLAVDGDVDPGLFAAVDTGLSEPRPPDAAALEARLQGYLAGARTYEAAAVAIEALVAGRTDVPALLAARAVHRAPWRRVAREAGLTPRAALREVRRQVARLVATRADGC